MTLIKKVISFLVGLALVAGIVYYRHRNKATSVVSNALIVPSELVVKLTGPINATTIEQTLQKMETIRKAGYKKALLVIESEGGSVFDGMRLIGYMQNNPAVEIDTFCTMLCASMAAHIFEHGKKRYIAPGTVIMFHQTSARIGGTSGQMKTMLDLFLRIEKELNTYVVKRSGMITEQEFEQKLKDEWWVIPQEALELNLADRMVILLED